MEIKTAWNLNNSIYQYKLLCVISNNIQERMHEKCAVSRIQLCRKVCNYLGDIQLTYEVGKDEVHILK